MSKTISEINSKLKELNSKYKESGLTDGKIAASAALSIFGKSNVVNLNKKYTTKRRIETRKTKVDKKFLLSQLKGCYFVRELAKKLGYSEATTRKILKDNGLKDHFKNIIIPNEIKSQKFSSSGGSKSNQPILCFYYPEMKPFRKRKFNSIKEANEYFNVTSISKVISGKTNSIRWNGKKITFTKIQ